MAQITVIGSTDADLNFDLPTHVLHRAESAQAINLPFGSKLPVNGYQLLAGGSGANVAVGLNKAGVKTQFLSAVSTDPLGQFLESHIKATGVEAEFVHYDGPSNISIILRVKGERTIITAHDPSFSYLEKPLPQSGWLHIGPLPAKEGKFYEKLVQHCVGTGQSVSYNPSIDLLEDRNRFFAIALRTAEIIFLNHQEAAVLAHLPSRLSTVELVRAVQHLGPKIVCVTDAEKGAYIGTKFGTYFTPALADSLGVIDTTGAGDAYASGFLAGYVNEPLENERETIERAIAFAMANASSVVCQIGGQAGLLSSQELEADARSVTLKKMGEQ